VQLAILRNKLLAKRFGEKEEAVLMNAKEHAGNWRSGFSDLVLFCLKNIEEDVLNQNFENASCEAQLIHNLPTTVDEVSSWDEKHFYLFELRSYLNKVNDLARVKGVIMLAVKLRV